MSLEWRIEAVFDTKEQARQAAEAMVASCARMFRFSVQDNGREIWREEGFNYDAAEQRV